MTTPEGAAIITAHPFTPRLEWWSTCRVCGYSEAAHAETTICQACGEPVETLGERLCWNCERS